jgi:hypothetical protein
MRFSFVWRRHRLVTRSGMSVVRVDDPGLGFVQCGPGGLAEDGGGAEDSRWRLYVDGHGLGKERCHVVVEPRDVEPTLAAPSCSA